MITDRWKPMYSEEDLSQYVNLCTRNPTWTAMRLNPILRGDRTAINRLSEPQLRLSQTYFSFLHLLLKQQQQQPNKPAQEIGLTLLTCARVACRPNIDCHDCDFPLFSSI